MRQKISVEKQKIIIEMYAPASRDFCNGSYAGKISRLVKKIAEEQDISEISVWRIVKAYKKQMIKNDEK